MTIQSSTVIVNAYREIAAGVGEFKTLPSYKGLPIHSLPELHEEVARLLDKYLSKGSAVIDLAAGSGALTSRMIDHGYFLEAVDFVPENFRLDDQVPFYEANLNEDFAQRLPRTYDAVVASEIIEHIENPRHFFRQCHQLLEAGGLVIVTTHNIESNFSIAQYLRGGNFYLFDEDFYGRDGHINPITSFTLKNSVYEAGFDIVDLFTAGGCSPDPWWKMRLLISILSKLRTPSVLASGSSIVLVARKRA